MFSKTRILIQKKYIFATYIVAIGLLLLGGILLRIYDTQEARAEFDSKAYVAQLQAQGTPIFEGVRDSMKQIIKEGGIQGMIDVNEYALVNNLYGIYQCHVISHMTGHEAVVYYGSDYGAVMRHDNHFCETGYRHGAEAQVALSGGNYKEELYAMCDAIHEKNPGAECFHGAGHAFMGETLDVDESLRMCDDLIDEEHSIAVVTPCYNAVFAELTNLVGGKDGGTGIDYTGGPPLSLTETPLEYCSKFGERYRVQCLFEFSGLGVSEFSTAEDIEKKLMECANAEYEIELEAACIKSVSAVGAQHSLAIDNTVTVPTFILSLPEELRRAYIIGAGTEMSQYIVSGAARDWHEFCDQFTESSDSVLCKRVFDGIE